MMESNGTLRCHHMGNCREPADRHRNYDSEHGVAMSQSAGSGILSHSLSTCIAYSCRPFSLTPK